LHTVFFDKTGTLTYGLPSVTEIYSVTGISKDQLIEAAASAERNSEHPLGRAIVRYAEQRKLQVREPESFEYCIGRGVLATVDGEPVAVGKRGLLEELGLALPEKNYKVGGTEVFIARGNVTQLIETERYNRAIVLRNAQNFPTIGPLNGPRSR
jgi:cation transport ATPase